MSIVFQINTSILQALSPERLMWLERGQMEFDQQGTIRYCGPTRKTRGPARVITMPAGSVVIPGLVDCHTHLSQYHARGKVGHTLLAWLKRHIFPEERHFKDPSYARQTSRGFFRELLSHGTTCAALYANYRSGVAIAFEEAHRVGIRGIIGYTLMDRGVPRELSQRAGQAMGECLGLFGKYDQGDRGLLNFSVNPRFVPACSPSMMRAIGDFVARHNVHVQTHISENVDEVRAVRRAFPDLPSYARVYDRFGLLTDRTLLAHCIHLSKAERDLIAQRGCSVVHCPSSNLFLHSGRFPLEHWRGYPKLGLGTDVAAGPSFSMADTMRDAYYVNQQRLSALFYYATLGGARALGLDGRIGNFSPGKEADFAVLRIADRHPLTPETVLSHLVFKREQVEVLQTFVRGKMVWKR